MNSAYEELAAVLTQKLKKPQPSDKEALDIVDIKLCLQGGAFKDRKIGITIKDTKESKLAISALLSTVAKVELDIRTGHQFIPKRSGDIHDILSLLSFYTFCINLSVSNCK